MLCGAVLLKPGCVAHVPLAAGFAAFFMGIRFIRWNQITNGRGFDLFALSLVKIAAIRSIA